MTIRRKLILSISVPLLVTYVGLLAWDYYRQRSLATEQMQALVMERAQTAASHLDTQLAAVEQMASSAAQMVGERPNLPDVARRAMLTSAFRQNRLVVGVTVVSDPGALTAHRGPGGVPRITEQSPEAANTVGAIAEAREQKKGAWGEPYEDAESNRWVCTYAMPVLIEETVRGVVAVTIPADQTLLRNLRPGPPDRDGGPGGPGGGPGGPGGPRGGRLRDFTTRPTTGRSIPTTESHPRRAIPTTELAPRVRPPSDSDLAPDLVPPNPVPEHVALLDDAGRMIASDAADTRRGESIFVAAEKFGKPDLYDAAETALNGKAVVLRVANLHDVAPTFSTDPYHWIAFAPIPSTGWILTAAISESTVMNPVLIRLEQRAAFLAAGMLVLLAVVLLVSIRISRPIERLAGAVDRLAAGDLDASVGDVRGRDELARLAGGFNDMTRQLKGHVAALTEHAAVREKVESELRIARQIQNDLLPRTFPPFPDRPEFELHAVNVPAAGVAGDFYDFFFTRPDLLTLVIADVSGKGVPAALLMAVTRTIIRNLAQADLPPAQIVERANAMLVQDTNANMFVTLLLAQYEPASGKLTYVNAGHPRPIRLSLSSPPQIFGDVTGPLLGVCKDDEMGSFEQREEVLAPGESLLLFTDGVTEAQSPAGVMLREAGLLDIVARHNALSPQPLCDAIVAEVESFEGGRRYDDVTLVVLRRSISN